MKKINIFIILFSLFILLFSTEANAYNEEEKMRKARLLYYLSVEDATKLPEAIRLFNEIHSKSVKYKYVAKIYVGSLTALKAIHTFWPHDKLIFAKKGIDIMEKYINKCPSNVEALFIQGSTLNNLPFFFGKKTEANKKFRKIIQILDESEIRKYDTEIIKNSIEYILINTDISQKSKKKAKRLLDKL